MFKTENDKIQSKKVLVEFFDSENLNNCVSQLHKKYDKTVYLYFSTQRTAKTEIYFKALTEFNRSRGGVEPEFIELSSQSVDVIIKALQSVVNSRDEFDIDITGGPEMFIIAGGIFFARGIAPNITIHRYDIPSGECVISYPGEFEADLRNYTLSVREQIRLHGALVEPDSRNRYNLSAAGLEGNIIKLWNAVKDKSAKWNSFCTLPKIIRGGAQGGSVFLKRTESDSEKKIYNEIADILAKKGIITKGGTETVNGALYSSFRINMPENAYRLFDKGGNLLEMYTYMACLKSEKTVDACTGVPVDWDGVVTGESGETKNEIDVIISDGRIPYFISCKNTTVTNEYFYEIKAMTKHYGGRYAKALLVTTSRGSTALRKRAEAMGIKLIENVPALSLAAFSKMLTE